MSFGYGMNDNFEIPKDAKLPSFAEDLSPVLL